MARNTLLLNRIRSTNPDMSPPKPPISLPEGNWIELRYPRRIPPLTRAQLRLWQRVFMAIIRLGSGDTYDYICFLVLVRLGRVFPLHTIFFTQLLQHGRIPAADSERVVIRVAWRMGCQYEYAHHTRMALTLGVSRDEVESLTRETYEHWTHRTRTLLLAADELLATKNLSSATFKQLQNELDDDQILELSMLVGHYVMAGMMLAVAGVEIEAPFALTVNP